MKHLFQTDQIFLFIRNLKPIFVRREIYLRICRSFKYFKKLGLQIANPQIVKKDMAANLKFANCHIADLKFAEPIWRNVHLCKMKIFFREKVL
jgi:hypothetical protein